MATIVKKVLSGSSDGQSISVQTTATAGTLIHAGPSSTAVIDEIYLWAKNESSSTAVQVLTIMWGEHNQTNSASVRITIPQQDGLYPIIPGLILQGNATPLEIRAVCTETSAVGLLGYVNRITQS